MGKGTIGVVSAILVFFGAALSAEAQGTTVTTTGPSAIDADDTTTTAVGNVTGATSGLFRARFFLNGVCKHSSIWYSFSGTTVQYTPPAGISSWGLYQGAQFRTEISIKVNYVVYTDSLTITVAAADGNYYGFAPADRRELPEPALAEQGLAWLDRKSFEVVA